MIDWLTLLNKGELDIKLGSKYSKQILYNMMDVGMSVSLKLLTAQKIKSFILDISNKRDQIHRKLQIGPHLRKKS